MEIGVDAGVGNIKVVFVENNEIIDFRTKKTEGRPIEKISKLLGDIKGNHKLSITGSEGKAISETFDLQYINHALSVLEGFQQLYPEARTVFDIGRESSCYYLFQHTSRGLVLADFSTNSICGAGGGSLIEKMAARLQFKSLEEFVEKASGSESAARIAGRCGVFAETDVVHHYQKGIPFESIASGLCFMLARNFRINVLQNKKIISPVYMIGNVSKNKSVVKFLEQLINERITIPNNQEVIKAYGAARYSKNLQEISLQEALEKIYEQKKFIRVQVKPLKLENSLIESKDYEILEQNGEEKVILSSDSYQFPKSLECFIGLDVGSVSTKAAILDRNGEFVFGIYRRTSGKPIDAVIDVIRRTGNYLNEKTEAVILGAGVTGSGRDVAGKIIGADIIRNEITAQARGASFFVPDVDTVFEIGGQDSKYIYMENGMVIDNEMNKACAASTGSFLEEQARILGISIEEQFAELALKSRNPCSLSEKCAILMASSLAHYQNSPLEDKCAGLAYSVCHNYLNRVIGKKPIGKNIVFQGAVAFNKAIVGAFETLLGKRIHVPIYPHLTGAVGIASITKEKYQNQEAT